MPYIPYTNQNMLIDGGKFWKQVQREAKMQKWNYLKQNKDLIFFKAIKYMVLYNSDFF